MGNLKDLSLALMVRLSEPWLDPKRSRGAIEKLPSGKALVGRIDTVFQGLLSTQKQDSKAVKELSALQQEEAGLDKRHDRVLRGIYWVLTGLAELAETAEEEAALLTARDELFPHGLSMTQRTYAEEAGEIALAEARIGAPSRALLKKVPLSKGKLWDAVESWFGLGREIGTAEEKRRALEAKVAGTDGSGASRAEALKARNLWIKGCVTSRRRSISRRPMRRPLKRSSARFATP
jgi:hypothetical protein